MQSTGTRALNHSNSVVRSTETRAPKPQNNPARTPRPGRGVLCLSRPGRPRRAERKAGQLLAEAAKTGERQSDGKPSSRSTVTAGIPNLKAARHHSRSISANPRPGRWLQLLHVKQLQRFLTASGAAGRV